MVQQAALSSEVKEAERWQTEQQSQCFGRSSIPDALPGIALIEFLGLSSDIPEDTKRARLHQAVHVLKDLVNQMSDSGELSTQAGGGIAASLCGSDRADPRGSIRPLPVQAGTLLEVGAEDRGPQENVQINELIFEAMPSIPEVGAEDRGPQENV